MRSAVEKHGKLTVMVTALALFYLFLISVPITNKFAPTDGTGSLLRSSLLRPKVAVVKPVFTATAYSSYYSFYAKYQHTPVDQVVKSDLSLLNVSIVDSWSWSEGLRQFLTSPTAIENGLILGTTLTVVTEMGVTRGELFNHDGSNRFQVVILGFTEYVTAEEYASYRHFVSEGGRLVLMDATNFLAEVKYYPQTNHLALVRGHGWSYDGKTAKRDVHDRWMEQNTNWIGSSFHRYGVSQRYHGAILTEQHRISRALKAQFGSRVFTSYTGHEENRVTNMTGTIILATWVQPSPDEKIVIAAYLHHYLRGIAIHLGVMGSDVVATDKSVQFFLIRSVFESTRV